MFRNFLKFTQQVNDRNQIEAHIIVLQDHLLGFQLSSALMVSHISTR